ncbi:MAG TPA: serine hydrolase [Rhizomicrobium sp.]|nr:serine hydrolase [Rhizomicrobium sp.]
MRKVWIVAGLAFGVSLYGCRTPPPPPPPVAEIWPTAGWPAATPESQGIDSNALAAVIENVRARHLPVHSIFVERNGYAVLDAYFFPYHDDETHGLASVTKSVVSTLVGIAQRDNRIGSLDQPVAALLPAESLGSDPAKSRITLANLLSMTAGLDCNAPPGVNLIRAMEESPDWVAFTWNLPLTWTPGTNFAYCGGNFHIVSAVLTAATGESASALAQSELFAPLGITQVAWPSDLYGNSRGFADLELHPRDAAKLGYLWLHYGRWQDQEIVPAEYLRAALTGRAVVEPGTQYGYGFWLYPGHTPYDYEANGHGGQRIVVVPSQNMVEVVTAGGVDANAVTPYLTAAYRGDAPLPPNPEGEARLAAAIAGAASAPLPVRPGPVPAWAAAISGDTFVLSDNPLGIRTIRLTFAAPEEASVQLVLANGKAGEYPVGLDGVPRVSRDVSSPHRLAMTGWWQANAFNLDWNSIAQVAFYRLHITPAPNGLAIHVTERTGTVDATMTAVRQAAAALPAPAPAR